MAFTTPAGSTLDSSYGDLSGFSSAYDQLYKQLQGLRSDSVGAEQTLGTRLNDATNQFASLFQNFVGRAPSQDEINKFLTENAGTTIANANGGLGRSEADPNGVRNSITQYISDTFQQQAKDFATQQLQGQQDQANTLANTFRTQGRQAISDTEQMLQTYAQNLFQQLQPQLLTSLQSKGMLNSGALNEAEAGAQKDLAAQAQGFLANANLNMENEANNIAFSGASAPYEFQRGNIMNQPGMLAAAGQGALNYGNTVGLNTLSFEQQAALMREHDANQFNMAHPGFGTNFSNSFGSSFGSGLGTDAAQFGNMNFAGFMGSGGGGGTGFNPATMSTPNYANANPAMYGIL